jgi:hypothetical protein
MFLYQVLVSENRPHKEAEAAKCEQHQSPVPEGSESNPWGQALLSVVFSSYVAHTYFRQ